MVNLTEIDQKTPEFMQAIDAFVKRPAGFLIISGSNGSGKSFVARAIHDHFAPHMYPAFWNQVQLNMEWQKDMLQYREASYLLDSLIEVPLLVLDDLGVRAPSEAFMDFLYMLSESRYELGSKRGTIITTNLNAHMMRERFGDPFFSRVASGLCLRCDGPDRRCSKF